MWKEIDVGDFVTGTQRCCMTGRVLERELPHSSSFFTSLIFHECLSLAKPTQNRRVRNPMDAVRTANPPRPQSCVDRGVDIGYESHTKDIQHTTLPHQLLSYKTRFYYFLSTCYLELSYSFVCSMVIFCTLSMRARTALVLFFLLPRVHSPVHCV